jgi:hypothetical protein
LVKKAELLVMAAAENPSLLKVQVKGAVLCTRKNFCNKKYSTMCHYEEEHEGIGKVQHHVSLRGRT